MFISKNHLNLFESKSFTLINARFKTLLEAYALGKAPDKDRITVFLSHKHDEIPILIQVIELLEELGVDVYVDWMDNEMPKDTSGETATKIKDKIRQNKKFILLATEKAINSKWCNWELGFGDNEKYPNNIAVMPITENDGTWSGNEYLQIYPIIKTEYSTYKGDYYVEFDNERTKLEEWLKS